MPRKSKRRPSKLSTPIVWSGYGGRLPAVRVQPPSTHFRLPKSLRSKMEEGATFEGRVLKQLAPARKQIAEDAFNKVQKDWWDQIPQKLAEELLLGPFGERPTTESAGKSSGYVTVRGVKTPTRWTPEQRQVWADYEAALHESLGTAEQTYRKDLVARLKAEKMKAEAEAEAVRKRARADKAQLAKAQAAEREVKRVARELEKWEREVEKYGRFAGLKRELKYDAVYAKKLAEESAKKSPKHQALLRVEEKLAKAYNKEHQFSPNLPKLSARLRRVRRALEKFRSPASVARDERERERDHLRFSKLEIGSPNRTRYTPASGPESAEAESVAPSSGKVQYGDSVMWNGQLGSVTQVNPDGTVEVTMYGTNDTVTTNPDQDPYWNREMDDPITGKSSSIEMEGEVQTVAPSSSLPPLPIAVAQRIDAEARERAEAEVGSRGREFAKTEKRIKKELWLQAHEEIASRAEAAANDSRHAHFVSPHGRFRKVEID